MAQSAIGSILIIISCIVSALFALALLRHYCALRTDRHDRTSPHSPPAEPRASSRDAVGGADCGWARYRGIDLHVRHRQLQTAPGAVFRDQLPAIADAGRDRVDQPPLSRGCAR